MNNFSFFIFIGMNSDINSAPSGIKILLTKKSIVSKYVSENNLNCESTPNDRVDGIPTAKIIIPSVKDVLILLELSPFIVELTRISSIEKPEVNAANKNNIKNPTKNILPSGTLLKTLGRTENSSEGPSAGLRLKVNTPGKIESPASSITSKFIRTILTVAELILDSRGR